MCCDRTTKVFSLFLSDVIAEHVLRRRGKGEASFLHCESPEWGVTKQRKRGERGKERQKRKGEEKRQGRETENEERHKKNVGMRRPETDKKQIIIIKKEVLNRSRGRGQTGH